MKQSWIFGLLIMAQVTPAGAQGISVTGRVEVVTDAGAKSALDAGNIVVWLTPLDVFLPGRETSSTPAQRPRLLQKNKAFDPHLLIVTQGSAVEFPNRDPFFHNVFSLFEGKRFDLGLYEAGGTRSIVFDRVGISYIFCNIHPEMSAVVIAVKSPYYGIADRAGQIVISSVPPGTYSLRVWCETCLPEALNKLSREIRVTERGYSFGTIRVTQTGNIRAEHKNKYGHDYESPSPPNPIYRQP